MHSTYIDDTCSSFLKGKRNVYSCGYRYAQVHLLNADVPEEIKKTINANDTAS